MVTAMNPFKEIKGRTLRIVAVDLYLMHCTPFHPPSSYDNIESDYLIASAVPYAYATTEGYGTQRDDFGKVTPNFFQGRPDS